MAIAVAVPPSESATRSWTEWLAELVVVGTSTVVMATFEVRMVNALASFADPATRI